MSTKIDLKEIELITKTFKTIDSISNELKKVQSIKCRLKKQKGLKSYDLKMTEILKKEQVLKEARTLLQPKKISVPEFSIEDIKILDFDETIKAIKSIQSKKANSKFLSIEPGNNQEYKKAVEIEQLLLNHKSEIRPIDETTIRKTEIKTLINEIENLENISKEKILELLNNLI